MSKTKSTVIILTIICIIATAMGVYLIGGIDSQQLQISLKQMGIVVMGTVWTTIAALVAAIVAFAFTRTIGREYTAKKFQGKWQAIDAEMQQGGLFYMFAIRLLPIIPYGIVNFVAGLTSIRFRDYFIGTLLGTVPGILPFVMMGAGLKSLGKGDILPLMVAFTLIALLVGVGTWYRRRRQFPFQ